jgi:hypothetical protein
MHEAGHAVVAARLGGPEVLIRVRLIADERLYGVKERLPPLGPERLMTLLAGGQAGGLLGVANDGSASDRAYFNRSLLMWLAIDLRDADCDETGFADHVARALESATATFAEACGRLVADSVEPIARFAAILAERRVLEGPELVAALHEAGVEPADLESLARVLSPELRTEVWRDTR